MKHILAKLIKAILVTIVFLLIVYVGGRVVNEIFGLTLFIFPKSEEMSWSNFIIIGITYIGILISNGIFDNNTFSQKISDLVGDSADIVLEIDKKVKIAPLYDFYHRGTQLDPERAEITKKDISYFFNIILYNSTFAEATIKDIQLKIGNKNKVLYNANYYVNPENYKNKSDFNQFMIHKGKSMNAFIEFLPETNSAVLFDSNDLSDYSLLEFTVEASVSGETIKINKKVKLNILVDDIEEIINISDHEIAKKIVGSDHISFIRKCKSEFGSYSYSDYILYEFNTK